MKKKPNYFSQNSKKLTYLTSKQNMRFDYVTTHTMAFPSFFTKDQFCFGID